MSTSTNTLKSKGFKVPTYIPLSPWQNYTAIKLYLRVRYLPFPGFETWNGCQVCLHSSHGGRGCISRWRWRLRGWDTYHSGSCKIVWNNISNLVKYLQWKNEISITTLTIISGKLKNYTFLFFAQKLPFLYLPWSVDAYILYFVFFITCKVKYTKYTKFLMQS